MYGIYIAATDGVSKAYVSEFIQKKESGTYFGAYYTLTAIGTFLASLIGGLLWYFVSPHATFFYGSLMAFTAFLLLTMLHNTHPITKADKNFTVCAAPNVLHQTLQEIIQKHSFVS